LQDVWLSAFLSLEETIMKSNKLNKLFLAMLLSVAVMAPAYAGTSILTAQRGGGYAMPVGASSVAANVSPSGKREILTRIPIGERSLVDLKSQSEALGFESAESEAIEVPVKGGPAAPEPLYASALCNTNVAAGFAPSDIHGAVGPSRLVVVTNVNIGVYNKIGCTTVSNVGLKTLFGAFGIPASQTLFDPRVLYDRSVGRFFVTAESSDGTNTDQYQYFAVSKDSTATAWWIYRFQLSKGTAFSCKKAANSFWDYPMSGKSSKRWFITANDFPKSGSATGAVLAINKTPTLTGAATSFKCFNNLAFNIAAPIVLDSSTQSVFLAPRSASVLRYNHTAGATIGADTLAAAASYAIASWTTPPNAVQPNGQKLDSLDGRFQSASLQSRDRIWNIHAVNFGGRPLIRWYRLQKSASSVLSTVTFQSTTTSHLFNPSFVTNSGLDGSPAFITASRTEPSPTCTAISCRAAMITFSGPNNSGGDWTQSLAGTSTSQFTGCNSTTSRGSCRWGDYSSITVDPNDAGRAWGFNQLINGTTQFKWFTRAAEEIYNLQASPASR
jgi:hypothetical protein